MTPLNETSGVANGLAGGAFAGSGPAVSRHEALVAALNQVNSDQAINLPSVSESDMTKILQIIGSPSSLEVAAQLEELLSSAVATASGGDVPRALAHLTEFAALDPWRAETLASEPALVSIRGEVTHLLMTLTFAAKADADARFEQARQSPAAELQTQESLAIQPKVALLFAERLMEAGGYAGFVHSAELSQLVLDHGRWMPAYVEAPGPRPVRLAPPIRVLLWIAVALVALLLVILDRSC
jgi:hypothetical protein